MASLLLTSVSTSWNWWSILRSDTFPKKDEDVYLKG